MEEKVLKCYRAYLWALDKVIFFYNKYQDKIDFWKNKNKAMIDKKNTKPGVLDTASKEMKTAVFSVLS